MIWRIGFAQPLLLLALALVPVLAAMLFVSFVSRRRALATFGGRGASLVSVSVVRQAAKVALLVVATAAVALALAGPEIGLTDRRSPVQGIDVVVALDVSQSMAVGDGSPDRLTLGKRAIATLGQRLVGSRLGLVLFAGGSFVRYPLTSDTRVLDAALDATGRQFRVAPGSSLRTALQASLKAFPPSADPTRAKAVVLVSDGEDFKPDLGPVTELRQRGIRIYTLGVGTVDGGPVPLYDARGAFLSYVRSPDGATAISHLDEDNLRSLADRGGGRYWHYVGEDVAVDDLANELRALATRSLKSEGLTPDDRYQLFLAIGVLALLLEWLTDERRPMPVPSGRYPSRYEKRRWLPRFAFLMLTALVSGACSGDPVAQANQSANERFASGDTRGALVRYQDLARQRPDLPQLAVNSGSALFRLGQYEQALNAYDKAIAGTDKKVRAIALYDRGDTLFRLGRLPDARAAFVDALKLDPNDRDAKYNIEVIDRILLPTQPVQEGRGDQEPQPGGQPSGPQGGPALGPPNPNASPGPAPASGSPAPGVPQALNDFRRDLTADQALRLLDALRGEQHGLHGIVEGTNPRGTDPQY